MSDETRQQGPEKTRRDGQQEERADALARESESFRILFDHAMVGLLLVETETKVLRLANPTICDMLGHSPEELIGQSIAVIHPADALPGIIEVFEAGVRGERNTVSDLPVKRADGSVFYADVATAKVQLGSTEYLLGTFHDVSPRRQTEEDLRHTTRLFETMFNAIPDVIGLQDRHHRVLRYNQAGLDFVGIGAEELGERRCYELIGRDEPCTKCATQTVYDSGKPASVERYEPRLGRWLEMRAYPIFNEHRAYFSGIR